MSPSMAEEPLVVTKAGGIATLTINRPERRNAVTQAMWQAIPDFMATLGADPEVRTVIIRGAGEEAFASGADIAEFRVTMATSEGALRHSALYEAALDSVEALPKPVMALIFGFAVGGGCGLATACDLRLASDTAKLGIPAGKLGIVYTLSSTRRLVHLVGPSRAKELLMTGRIVDAKEALEIGLVDHVRPGAELTPFALDLAAQIAASAPLTLKGAKLAVRYILEGITERREEEIRGLRLEGFSSEDFKEGVRAFLEKRSPRFEGK